MWPIIPRCNYSSSLEPRHTATNSTHPASHLARDRGCGGVCVQQQQNSFGLARRLLCAAAHTHTAAGDMPFGKAKAAAQKPEAAAPRTHLSRTAGPCPCSDCTPPGAVPSLGRYCAWRGGFFRLPDGEKAWPDDLKVSPGLAWFDGNVARWETLLKNTGWLRPCGCCPGRPPPPAEKSISSLAVLELGSWEGNSTAWMLSHMCWRPGDYVVAVDDWSFASQGSSKEVEAELKEKVAAAEEYFDFNTSKVCVKRVCACAREAVCPRTPAPACRLFPFFLAVTCEDIGSPYFLTLLLPVFLCRPAWRIKGQES
jgi:hypothetical protein